MEWHGMACEGMERNEMEMKDMTWKGKERN